MNRSQEQFQPSRDVREIRERLDFPVVDADGHQIEFAPLVYDILKDVAGLGMADRYWKEVVTRFDGRDTPFGKAPRVWALPAKNTLDRATGMLPDLMYKRMDEMGMDFSIVYPAVGLVANEIRDTELRQSLARALNIYNAEVYAPYRDRLEPVATIPNWSPEEAIAELNHAVGELGLKTVVMSGVILRDQRPDGTPGPWLDTPAFGSIHNFDPVWARCVELGVAPGFHTAGVGWGSRVSPTNYIFNKVGSFAAAQEAACRSLIVGGVPRRFPKLRFAFLEGGVSWGCQLYADMLTHFEKRNKDAVLNYDPATVDRKLFRSLFEEHSTGRIRERLDKVGKESENASARPGGGKESPDDFLEAQITSKDDIRDMFTRQFYFGCEADDPMTAVAFNTKLLPRRARLNAMFGSDIGHWDVPDMREVIPEAWELVDHGHIDEAEFRDFMFGNVVRMVTDMNPRFFDGTAVEDAVKKQLAR